jgi:hypothetical protein
VETFVGQMLRFASSLGFVRPLPHHQRAGRWSPTGRPTAARSPELLIRSETQGCVVGGAHVTLVVQGRMLRGQLTMAADDDPLAIVATVNTEVEDQSPG